MAVKKIGTLNKHENPATNENEFDIEDYMNANWDKIKEVVDNNADELSETQTNKVDKVDGKGLSTEDYTTAEKQKLAGLNNYDDTEIKEDIQDIKTEQTTQNTKLQELEDNQIHITTERTSNLNVQDASGQNAKINIFGISKQETRSGKNKFDVTKLENVENIDSKTGSFAIKAYGTWIMAEENVSKLLKPNTQYKCIADVTLIESPQNASEGIATLLALNSSSAGSNAILSCSSLTEKNTWQLNETKRLESSFTTASDLSIFNMIHYGYHTSDWQATGKFKFENIMILEATEEDETFEEYGESPSPKYHSEIENTTGNVKITSCNKNLFNKNTVTEGKNIGNNGEFVINNNYFISDYILINKNVSLALTGIEWGRIAFYDKDKNFIKYSANAESNDLIATSTEDTKYAVISSIIATIDNVQLEANNVATDFIAHEEQLITFPLAEGQRLADGDKLASDGIHHVRDVYIFKAVTSLSTYQNNKYGINTGAVNSINTSNILSNRIVGSYSTKENTGYITGGGETVVIYGNPADTVKSFNEKFVGTKIEYPLAKEKIEPYTPEQQEAYNKLQNVLSYYKVTNVFTDKAQLVFKYIADTKTYVDNEINSIKEQLNTINELLSTTTTSAMLLDNMQTDLESEVL